MELKKGMKRKTNIIQLVSMCLGAVLALSMVLLPVNAAFAQGIPQDPYCQELEQRFPPGLKEHWKQECGPDVIEKDQFYCEYLQNDPDFKEYLENCEEPGFPVDMEARAQSCEELAQTLPPYLKEILEYIKQDLNDHCGPDAIYEGQYCKNVKQDYNSEFPGVTKYIDYKCEELEQTLPGEWENQEDDVDVYPIPEIKSGEIKNGDICKGEVSDSHGGNYTGTWRIVKDGGCGQKGNGVKICDRNKGNGNVGPVEVEAGDCCYAKWDGGQSYIGSIFYDKTSQTFGCDSY